MAWTAEAGKGMSVVVSFNPVDTDRTRVTAQIEWQPEGVIEEVGAAMGFDDRQVKEDLDRFRDLMESNGVATGGWRGDIDNGSSSTMR